MKKIKNNLYTKFKYLGNIGMLYTVGKLSVPSFHWEGGHDRVFVSMVAAPLKFYSTLGCPRMGRRGLIPFYDVVFDVSSDGYCIYNSFHVLAQKWADI